MKRLFHTSFNIEAANIWLLLLRILTASFMLTHGYPKLEKLLAGGEIKFADPFGIGAMPSLVLVVFAEFVCSVFIMLGLGTRLAAIFGIITMLVAAFNAHLEDPFNKKEMALLYVLCYITLLVFGSGKYSVDNLITHNSNSALY